MSRYSHRWEFQEHRDCPGGHVYRVRTIFQENGVERPMAGEVASWVVHAAQDIPASYMSFIFYLAALRDYADGLPDHYVLSIHGLRVDQPRPANVEDHQAFCNIDAFQVFRSMMALTFKKPHDAAALERVERLIDAVMVDRCLVPDPALRDLWQELLDTDKPIECYRVDSEEEAMEIMERIKREDKEKSRRFTERDRRSRIISRVT